jgi:hypothetical protein
MPKVGSSVNNRKFRSVDAKSEIHDLAHRIMKGQNYETKLAKGRIAIKDFGSV